MSRLRCQTSLLCWSKHGVLISSTAPEYETSLILSPVVAHEHHDAAEIDLGVPFDWRIIFHVRAAMFPALLRLIANIPTDESANIDLGCELSNRDGTGHVKVSFSSLIKRRI